MRWALAVTAVAVLAAACAPVTPEQRAENQQRFAAGLQCEQFATQQSGVLATDIDAFDLGIEDDDFRPSQWAAQQRFRLAYRDCMREHGFASTYY